MSASLKKLEGLSHELTITVPADELNKKYQELLEKAAKKASLPGFRVGKVPPHILAQKFGKEIRQDAINEVMQGSMQAEIQKSGLQITGQPNLVSLSAEEGKDLTFTLNFETYPEVKLADLSQSRVERMHAEIAEKDIDTMLETLRKQNAEWVKADTAAKKDDRVVIDFDGSVDGVPFQGGKAEKFKLQLGAGQMIPGFEDGIVGMKAGDEKVIQVTFPAEYPAEELKGKKADFKITMHEVLEPKLPELDAEFAKKMGFQALDTMRDEVRKSMQHEIENVVKQRLKMAVLDQLLEKNTIQVPNALLKAEVAHLQSTTRQKMVEQYGKEAEKIELPTEPYEKEAEKRVKLGLLLGEIIKERKLKVDHSAVHKKIEEIAQNYQDPAQVVAWYHNNKQMMSQLESVILEDSAVDVLLSQMQVTDKNVSYEDAIKQPAEK